MAVDPLAAFRMDGQVALVTGASSGFGARFARVLHAVGAEVVLSARRVDRLEALAEELGGGCHIVPGDVSTAAGCEALAEEALASAGRVDVLVNNAGISFPQPAEQEPIEQWRQVMAVNIDAAFHLSQLLGRPMLERGHGVIVNVASIMGLVGVGQTPQASYNASKAALVNLTRELAAEWARRGVRVNCLCPGYFPTEITAELFESEWGLKFLRRRTPLGRGGEEGELDGALLLLASPAGSYLHGTALVVDGGWTAV
jgi:NAD(P)-dependent dehydrogenase (short-subunit alcohol dehydrogenase family)